MKNIKIPLFLKFAIVMIFLSVAPLIFVGIRTVNINRESLQSAILDLHIQTARSFAEKINSYLNMIDKEIPYIINILSAPEIPWETREIGLKTMLESHKNIVSISMMDPSGRERTKIYNPVLEKQTRLINRSKEQIFQEIVSKKTKRAISKLYYFEDRPQLNLLYKINENVLLHIVLTLEDPWNELYSIKAGRTGHAFLVDSLGKIIAHRDKNKIFQDAGGLSIVRQAVRSLSDGSCEYEKSPGEWIVGSYDSIKGLDWFIIVEQSRDEAYHSSIVMRNQAVLLIVLSVFLSALVAFFVARNLTKPILVLIKSAGNIARRDFSSKISLRTNDELNNLITTFNDMTDELKKYDDMQIDKIIAEKTKTEAIIFSIADGIIMTDHTGEILLVNTPARNIIGIGKQPVEGKVLWDYISDKRLREAMTELLNIGDTENMAVREIDLSQEKALRFYKAATKPVITLKGETIGIVTVVRDITLEKEIDRMKDDFLHSITHDLRNPMTSIRGFMKFLLDGIGGTLTEQQKKMIETMDRASLRLMGMINDILDLAKLESGRMEIQPTGIDVYNISKKVLELLEPQLVKKSIQATVELLNGTQNTAIRADGKLIERAIINLVGNAIKFTPENGKILIGLMDSPDRLTVHVTDNGEGIHGHYLEKIFDKFGQVTGQKRGGTGLGLTICKYIVEAHGGGISVRSEPEKGSTFTFYIPKQTGNQQNNQRDNQ